MIDSFCGSGDALVVFLPFVAVVALVAAVLLGGGDGDADLPSSRFRFSRGFLPGSVRIGAGAGFAAVVLVAVVLVVVVVPDVPAAGVAAFDLVARAGGFGFTGAAGVAVFVRARVVGRVAIVSVVFKVKGKSASDATRHGPHTRSNT